jgi:hypothetical protein
MNLMNRGKGAQAAPKVSQTTDAAARRHRLFYEVKRLLVAESWENIFPVSAEARERWQMPSVAPAAMPRGPLASCTLFEETVLADIGLCPESIPIQFAQLAPQDPLRPIDAQNVEWVTIEEYNTRLRTGVVNKRRRQKRVQAVRERRAEADDNPTTRTVLETLRNPPAELLEEIGRFCLESVLERAGALAREQRQAREGKSKHGVDRKTYQVLYQTWRRLMERLGKATEDNAPVVADAWLDLPTFLAEMKALGPKPPFGRLRLKEAALGYVRGNVEWASAKTRAKVVGRSRVFVTSTGQNPEEKP